MWSLSITTAKLFPNFKTIGIEVSEIIYYEQSHIYVFIYIDICLNECNVHSMSEHLATCSQEYPYCLPVTYLRLCTAHVRTFCDEYRIEFKLNFRFILKSHDNKKLIFCSCYYTTKTYHARNIH
jgi:hypothetical protein